MIYFLIKRKCKAHKHEYLNNSTNQRYKLLFVLTVTFNKAFRGEIPRNIINSMYM